MPIRLAGERPPGSPGADTYLNAEHGDCSSLVLAAKPSSPWHFGMPERATTEELQKDAAKSYHFFERRRFHRNRSQANICKKLTNRPRVDSSPPPLLVWVERNCHSTSAVAGGSSDQIDEPSGLSGRTRPHSLRSCDRTAGERFASRGREPAPSYSLNPQRLSMGSRIREPYRQPIHSSFRIPSDLVGQLGGWPETEQQLQADFEEYLDGFSSNVQDIYASDLGTWRDSCSLLSWRIGNGRPVKALKENAVIVVTAISDASVVSSK